MPRRVLPALLLTLLVGVGLVHAAGPRIWVVSGAEAFAAGQPDGAAIDSTGAVRLAPSLSTVAVAPEPRIWSVARGDDALYIAAGEQGRVLRQSGAGEPGLLFEVDELGAQALAWGPDGNLYVAAGPRGGIYRVPPDHAGGELEPWFLPETTYVWDMLFAPDGDLYVATGGDGKILRVSPDGTGETVYDTSEPHVTALAFDAAGRLLAGTEGQGLVYRISSGGDVFVLYDSPLREITDLLVLGDRVWASAFGSDSAPTGDDAARASRAAGGEDSNLRGAVFEIESDGYARESWRGGAAYALAAHPAGVLVGTDDGVLRLIERSGGTALVARTEADQIVALRGEGDGFLVVTSNPGVVHRLGLTARTEGLYESPVRDTGTISHWGTIRWYASLPTGAGVRISTRSGNTAEPDDTWSDWSAAYAEASGSGVGSPPARFVQWRAELSAGSGGATPMLHRVELAYVARNLAPRIEELTVHPAGVVYRQNASFEDGLPFAQLPASVARALRESDPTAAGGAQRAFLGRPFYISNLQTITWQASDPNDDALSYRLEFRGEAESEWKPLEAALEEGQYVLDTRRFPDGTYLVRLTVDDGRAHAPVDALTDTRVSRPFRVDNSAPEVDGVSVEVEGGRAVVSARATDRTSLIESVQYSVDGRDWRTVVPADGVADSAQEAISIVLENLSMGEHVVVIRVTDTALNEGAGRIVFESR